MTMSERGHAELHRAPARGFPRGLWRMALGVVLLLLALIALAPSHAVAEVRAGSRWLGQFLSREPFVLLFSTVAAGFGAAKLRVRDIPLGATAGTIIVALMLSLWANARSGVTFKVPEFASTIFFDLFMFSVGMKVGPQFLAGLNRGARAFIALAFIGPVLSASSIVVVRWFVHPPYGMTAGIFAGANTATPGLGAATAAFNSGAASLPSGMDSALAIDNMSTAFAFSYCISVVSFAIVLKALPRLSKRDPVAEARRFETEVGANAAPLPGTNTTFLAGSLPVERRTYRLERPDSVGATLGELRERYPLVDVVTLRRRGAQLPIQDETRLELSDEVTVFGRVSSLLEFATHVGVEIVDPELAPLRLETLEIVQLNDAVVGKTLRELVVGIGHGIHLNAMFRAGEEIPRGPEVVVRRGDVMRVTGIPEKLERFARLVGPAVRPSVATDILTLTLGLALGGLLGALTLRFGKAQFALGSVALLIVGVLLSTLRTRNPTLGGPFPEPARQLLEDLGLNVFVAVLGLNAGAGVIKAVQGGALLPVLLGTVCAGLLPPLAVFWFGLHYLKTNTAELMGAVAGARCASSGLRTAQEVSQSAVPAIAYTVTFAISNVLFTLMSYGFALLE